MTDRVFRLTLGLCLAAGVAAGTAGSVPACDNGDPAFDLLAGDQALLPFHWTDSITWAFRESIPVPLTRTAGIVDPDGKIRVICGNTMLAETSYQYQQIFDPTLDVWIIDTTVSHPGQGVHNHDVEIIGDTIYVGWGSHIAGYYNNLTMIDLTSGTWTVVGPAPTSNLLYYEFAVCNGKLYCFGGSPSGSGSTNSARVFDPTTQAWTSIANVPRSLRDPAAATLGDSIFLFGGFSSGNTAINNSYVYNTATNTWATLASLPQARGWATAHVVVHPDSGAFIYVCGGQSGASTYFNRVDRYDVAANTWATETPFQRVRRSHAGVVIEPCSLYVITGYATSRPFLRSAEIGVPSGWARPGDVGATEIVAPVGQVDSGTPVVPRAVVENFGPQDETFDVRFAIDALYADTQTVNVPAGQTDTVDFAVWIAQPLGVHVARCSTMLAGDTYPANDAVEDTFEVIPGVGVTENPGPRVGFSFRVGQPNPVSGQVVVEYSLAQGAEVELVVFSADGRAVCVLDQGMRPAGAHRVVWDGFDSRGREANRGIYYCRLRAGPWNGVRKLVRLD